MTRREELISAGVLEQASDRPEVAPDWIRRLDAERLGARAEGRASRGVERGPSVVGRVTARSAGGFALRDLQGRDRVLRLRDVGLRTAPALGVELWSQPRERTLARGEIMREERRERSRETERGGAPARAEPLRASELRGGPDRWTKADEILAREGAVAEAAGESPAVQALREREELWRRRGIAIDEQFEQRARQWLEERFRVRELESLPEAARRLGRPGASALAGDRRHRAREARRLRTGERRSTTRWSTRAVRYGLCPRLRPAWRSALGPRAPGGGLSRVSARPAAHLAA